jgi:hypothetical protein
MKFGKTIQGKRIEGKWGYWKRPSLFMPSAAVRTRLEILEIKVERLHDISEADAIAEGVLPLFSDAEINDPIHGYKYELDLNPMPFKNYLYPKTAYYSSCKTARDSYFSLWEMLNGEESLNQNPFVWVIKFKLLNNG